MPDVVRFRVRVKARSKRPGIGPWQGGALCVRTPKPAVGGQANADVLKRLNKALGYPVSMVSGAKARLKSMKVQLPAGQRVEDLLP